MKPDIFSLGLARPADFCPDPDCPATLSPGTGGFIGPVSGIGPFFPKFFLLPNSDSTRSAQRKDIQPRFGVNQTINFYFLFNQKKRPN